MLESQRGQMHIRGQISRGTHTFQQFKQDFRVPFPRD
jgi:hypothetical protein